MVARYVIYGAGAIGGCIGGALATAGHEVVLVARGEHLAAMQSRGLRMLTPAGEQRPPAVAVGSAAEARVGRDDVVVIATKSQDTEAVVTDLASTGVTPAAVVCAQNGVDNERVVARRGLPAYGMYVVVPAAYQEAGVVELYGSPVGGVLDLGRFPTGSDEIAAAVASDLTRAGFSAEASADIMRWKYAKLLDNVGNALDAACGFEAREHSLFARARAEAQACFAAAGIHPVSAEDTRARAAVLSGRLPVSGRQYPGSSSWQSLARGTGSIEADWLNGEIVLLGTQYGISTPVNAMLQRTANRMARQRLAPGTLAIADLEAQLAR
ncbi:MAG: ketopantoate reductase family protein [Actinomycetota bacterium]|nr:MAG: ketopantoate reductase family protein [Actinomycetota bacterium]